MTDLRTLSAVEDEGVRGHVFDPADLTRRFAVELLVEGLQVGLARAHDVAPEISDVGDGCYGFGFSLPRALLERGCGLIEVRLANTGEPVGAPLRLPAVTSPARPTTGRVVWAGGLRLCGSLPVASGPRLGVRAIVEGREAARALCSSWTYAERGTLQAVLPAFDLRLPIAFADGRVHRVRVLDDEGKELAGSPCALLAFPDGLRSFVAGHAQTSGEEPRAELLERLMPQSLPFNAWATWKTRYSLGPVLPTGPVPISVILVGDDVQTSLPSLEDQSDTDWTAAQISESGGYAQFDAVELDRFLDGATDDSAVVLALAGTRFHANALTRLDRALTTSAAASIVYPDAEMRDGQHRWPLLWPAYDAERQLEQGYGALVFAARTAAVRGALRRGACSLPAIFLDLAACEDDEAGRPVHMPDVLVELPTIDTVGLSRTLAQAACQCPPSGVAVEIRTSKGAMMPAIRVARQARSSTCSVALIAPHGREPSGEALDALRARLGSPAPDLIVASHLPVQDPRGWRALTVAGCRNASRLRNAAAHAGSHGTIVFLDVGTMPLDTDWYAEMAGRMAAPSVSAVGALLLGPNDIVLNAGMVLGVGFSASPAFAGLRHGDAGYADSLLVARSCGALDANGLMVSREDFLACGGFDDLRFPEFLGSVDLSLRLRAGGRRLLFTPHARFASDAPTVIPSKIADAERTRLRNLWGPDLLDDPFYHPALNLDDQPFTGLAWPPRPAELRLAKRPCRGSSPSGF